MKHSDQRSEPLKPIPLTLIQRNKIEDSMGLAFKAAFRRFKGKHGKLTFPEVLSAASMGLIHAVTHYKENLTIDPDNMRWCTYALRCCDGAICNDMKKDNLIHVPHFYLTKKGKEALAKRKEEYYSNKKIRNKNGRMIWFTVDKAMNIFPEPKE